MIQIRNLYYSIGSIKILEDINLDLTDGEFSAIIGPNGAGKTTLIRLLLGLLPLQEGSILIDGVPHIQWLKKNPVGYLPQGEVFDRNFPARTIDIVLMGLAGELPLGARFKATHKKRAREAMQTTQIPHLAQKYIGELSGGELQRVFLARAIVSESKYLILDEPEASIDMPGVKSFFALLRDLNKAGKTIITISHDLNILTEYCSFLICLNRTLHCHTKTELVNAEHIHKTFGEHVHVIKKEY